MAPPQTSLSKPNKIVHICLPSESQEPFSVQSIIQQRRQSERIPVTGLTQLRKKNSIFKIQDITVTESGSQKTNEDVFSSTNLRSDQTLCYQDRQFHQIPFQPKLTQVKDSIIIRRADVNTTNTMLPRKILFSTRSKQNQSNEMLTGIPNQQLTKVSRDHDFSRNTEQKSTKFEINIDEEYKNNVSIPTPMSTTKLDPLSREPSQQGNDNLSITDNSSSSRSPKNLNLNCNLSTLSRILNNKQSMPFCVKKQAWKKFHRNKEEINLIKCVTPNQDQLYAEHKLKAKNNYYQFLVEKIMTPIEQHSLSPLDELRVKSLRRTAQNLISQQRCSSVITQNSKIMADVENSKQAVSVSQNQDGTLSDEYVRFQSQILAQNQLKITEGCKFSNELKNMLSNKQEQPFPQKYFQKQPQLSYLYKSNTIVSKKDIYEIKPQKLNEVNNVMRTEDSPQYVKLFSALCEKQVPLMSLPLSNQIKLGNLGIPILSYSKLQQHELNKMNKLMDSPMKRSTQKDWQKMKVMLPIVKQGENAQYANDNSIMYSVFNLTSQTLSSVQSKNKSSESQELQPLDVRKPKPKQQKKEMTDEQKFKIEMENLLLTIQD